MSLYVFLFVSLVVWLTITKVVRWVLATMVPLGPKPDSGSLRCFVFTHRIHMHFLITSTMSIGIITLIFKYLSVWFPFFQQPHTLLTMAITVYMMASTFVDSFVPDIPVP